MTVCIVAVCESGKQIVVAADRMLTFPPPLNLEFETEEQKLESISKSCVALVSGDTGNATEILHSTRKKIGGNREPMVEQVAAFLKDDYTSTKLRKFHESTTAPMLGIDYESFLAKGGTLPAYLQPQSQVYQQLTMMSAQYSLGVDIIVAGIDSTGAHIFVVTHPGTIVSLDKLGYGAIGSGGIHTTMHLSLSGQTRNKGLLETLYNVYVGKKASEAAPGVGQVTDVAVIEGKGIWHCTEPVTSMLETMFQESSKKQMPATDGLKKVYDEQHPA